MKKLFGTDGIRGPAGAFPLDRATVSVIGASLARHLRSQLGRDARLVVGRDTRESGPWIEKAIFAGAAEEAAQCRSAAVITTPGVAFLTRELGFDAGIVISASHNPFEDNGIKIFLPTGEKLDETAEAKIEADVGSRFGEAAGAEEIEVDTASASEFQQLYSEHLRDSFKGLSLTGVKMVIDCANGASSQFVKPLFEGFGAETVVINDSPDGRNINKDCGSLHLAAVQERVLEEKADFGVAFDGDADRSLFVDKYGTLVDGDAVLWIMAQHLGKLGRLKNNMIVATVMSNIGLEIALDSINITLLRTPVGDKYVLQELIRTGSSVGGEQSGHIIFPEESLVGDGIFTSLYLLKALQADQKSLTQMTSGFTKYPQILVNVKVREKRPFEVVPEIMAAATGIETELGQKGRLLLRYSGTENLARVMIEGECQTRIDEQANRLARVIENVLG